MYYVHVHVQTDADTILVLARETLALILTN